MRIAFKVSMLSLVAVLLLAGATVGQTRPASASANAPFDPHDLNGAWFRTTPIQTFTAAPGAPGAQRGTTFPELPFTAAGKAKFDKNFPGYGPRSSPARRNDPMG